ncbi:MAG: hypothetical protein WCF78_03355 [archaeon]
MKTNSKLLLVTTTLIILGILVGYQVFWNTTNTDSFAKPKQTSNSICWNSLKQTCNGSCFSQADCGAGSICIARECPSSIR